MIVKSLVVLAGKTRVELSMFTEDNWQNVFVKTRVDFLVNDDNVAPNDKQVDNSDMPGEYEDGGVGIREGKDSVNDNEKSSEIQISSYESTIKALRLNCNSSFPNMDVFGWGLGSPDSNRSNSVSSRGRDRQEFSGSSDSLSRSISMDSCASSPHSISGEGYRRDRSSEDRSMKSSITDKESLQSEVSLSNRASSDNIADFKLIKNLLPKKYFCGVCHQGFTRKHNMVSHELIHSTARPHTCHACKKLFRRVHDLRRHERLHVGDKPFECNKCLRKFARRDALRRHLNSPNACVSYHLADTNCKDPGNQGMWINSSVKGSSETEGTNFGFVPQLFHVSSQNGNSCYTTPPFGSSEDLVGKEGSGLQLV